MRLLLDTHTLLWYATRDLRLSSTAAALIRDKQNEIFVSPASYWEMAIKVSTGKYALTSPFESFMRHAIEGNQFQILPILIEHSSVLAALSFPSAHKDPFDRLIVAQAIYEQMRIVSADSMLDQYPIQRLW